MNTKDPRNAGGENVATKSNKPGIPRPVRWLREILAISVWLLLGVQLFIFDIMSYIEGQSDLLGLLLRFRLLAILVAIAFLLLFLGNRRFFLFFGYILAYPFVVVCWHIPRILFKNWAIAVAFSPAVYSILSSFKVSFISFVAALLSTFLVSLATYRPLIATSMAVIAAYLVYHFSRRFRVAFSPSTVFADAAGAIGKTWGAIKDSALVKRPEGLALDSDEYKQKYGQNLLTLYMLTTGLWFVGERLREVVRSRKLDMYFLVSLLYTFILTAVLFGFEYFGLYRLLPGSFVGVANPGLIDFLGLSFSTLMTSDISPLKPATGIAQISQYIQLFGSLLIVVLLVFVILTSIRERYRQDLDEVISELGVASDRIGSLLESNYELTIAGLEAWLLDFNPGITKWCLKIRHGEEGAKAIEAKAGRSAEPAHEPDV